MKTKLLFIAFILLSLSSKGQINIQEKSFRNFKKVRKDLNFTTTFTEMNKGSKKSKSNFYYFPTSQKADSIITNGTKKDTIYGRDYYYENIYSKTPLNDNSLMNNVAFQVSNNTAAVSSELVASYMRWVRVSFGTLMTNSSSSSSSSSTSKMAATTDPAPSTTNTASTDAFQRLLSSGGGNMYLNFDLPICYYKSDTFTFLFNSNSRLGLTVKQFSNDVDTSTGSGNVCLNMYGSASSDDKKSFTFFFNGSFGGYAGGSDYYSQLNLAKNGIFAFSHLTFGVDIMSSLRFTYTAQTFGSDENLRSTRGVVGIQLLKGLFDKK